MKCAWVILLASIAALSGACQHSAHEQQSAGIDPNLIAPARMTIGSSTSATDPNGLNLIAAAFFHDHLIKYGQWINTPEYGLAWSPAGLRPGWRPYSVGHWIYNDGCGWLWVGSEKWGWATEHYGRWVFLDSRGWVWVPGRQWSPAWVAWRNGDDFAGWAPLPPTASDDVDVTKYSVTDIPAYAFTFVPEKFLADENLAAHFEPVTRNVTLLARTTDSTRYYILDQRIINRGIDIADVEQAANQPIRRFHVVEENYPHPPKIDGDDVLVYRPNVTEPDLAMAMRQARRSSGEPDFNPDLTSAERERLDLYHRKLRDEMLARQAREQASENDPRMKADLIRHQQEERYAFEDERQREVEALRRKQLDERERFAAAHQPAAGEANAPNSGGARQAKHYEIPPEWQIPPEMLQRSASGRAPPPESSSSSSAKP